MKQKIDISTFLDLDTPSSVAIKLTERFKKRRKELKFSRKELSEQSGVSYASIRRFEDTGEISLSSLLKLAVSFDCLPDFDVLFKESKAKDLKDME